MMPRPIIPTVPLLFLFVFLLDPSIQNFPA
jgi:hypothetical protein